MLRGALYNSIQQTALRAAADALMALMLGVMQTDSGKAVSAKIRLSSLCRRAESDLAAAVEWYEERRLGLGRRFLDEPDQVFGRVVERPTQFPLIADVRRALLRRFPFSVSFAVVPDRIEVNAGLHQEFGGSIRLSNRPQGGAEVKITLSTC